MPRQLIFSFLPEIVDVFCSKILKNRFPGNNTYLTKSSREKQLSKSCREMCVHFSCLSLNYKNHSWPRINLLHITKGNVFHFLIGWECGSRWTELKKKKATRFVQEVSGKSSSALFLGYKMHLLTWLNIRNVNILSW